MLIKELIGKKITNIYELIDSEPYGLDTAECFIELDNEIIIDIPFGESENVWIKKLNKNAISIFKDLSDYPIYFVNKEKKTIQEITEKYQKQRKKIYNKIKKFFFGIDVKIKEYQPYKIEYKENKLKYLKNKIIIDFLWFPDEIEKGFLLLDNDFLITETPVAPQGLGLAGLNFYESLDEFSKARGTDFVRLTQI